MQFVPVIVVIAGLAASFGSLITGFVLTFRMVGWQAMMQPTPQGKWSLPRRLVYGGAMGAVAFNCLLIVLVWIPGALPWR